MKSIKKVALFFFLIVMASSFCLALSQSDLYRYFSFDGNCNDLTGTENCDVNGGTSYSTNAKLGSNALYLDGAAGTFLDSNWGNGDFNMRTSNFSICFWINISSVDAFTNDYFFGAVEAGTNEQIFHYIYDGSVVGKYDVGIGDGDLAGLLQMRRLDDVSDPLITTGGYQYFCFVKTNSTTSSPLTIYQNATVATWLANTYTGAVPDSTIDSDIYFFARHIGGGDDSNMRGYIDEIAIFSKELTAAEIALLYNNGNGLSYSAIGNIPTYVYPTATDGVHNNIKNLSVNATCSASNTLIWLSQTNPPNTLVHNSANSYANLSSYLTAEGAYYYVAGCQGGSNASIRTYYYDYSLPTITLNTNNLFSAANNTRINQENTSTFLNITFADNVLLFAKEINITDAFKNQKYYNHSTNISLSSLTFSQLLNITGWDIGTYTAHIEVADAHTAVEIGKYIVEKKNDELVFSTEEKNSITITAKDAIEASTVKEKDRYSFEFTYPDREGYREYTLKSSSKIFKIKNDMYKGWFVIYDEKTKKGNWVDFEGEDVSGVYSTKVSDNEYRVTVVYNSDKESSLFNSVGGLNILSIDYSFNITAQGSYNPYISVGDIRVWNYSGKFNITQEVSINASAINSILADGCSCTNCTISGTNCRIPIRFNAGNNGRLIVNMTNMTYKPTVHKLNITLEGQQQFYNGTYIEKEHNVTLNSTKIVEIVDLCTCTLCTISGTYCRFPLSFYSSSGGTLRVSTAETSVEYFKTLRLWDEKNNSLFNVANLTEAHIYIGDLSLNLKNPSNSTFNITYSTSNTTARIELVYEGGTIINRYIDMAIVENNAKICANPQGTTYHEQIMKSASVRKAILKNTFSDCYVAADYTRFAYENAYALVGHTIDASYYLITDVDGVETTLANIDGSKESYQLLDTIEFSQQTYNANILMQALSIYKLDETSGIIYIDYVNQNEPNTALTITITNEDNDAVLYTSSAFANMDNVSIAFNYMAFSINETTLMKATATRTNSAGTETIVRYFNTFAKTGLIHAGIALTIALLLTIFGLTFAVSKVTFSWFGLFMVGISIGVLSFAAPVWYTRFFMAINIVIMVFIGIMMYKTNYETIAG